VDKSTVLRTAVNFLFFAFLSTKLTDTLKTFVFQGLFHDPVAFLSIQTYHPLLLLN